MPRIRISVPSVQDPPPRLQFPGSGLAALTRQFRFRSSNSAIPVFFPPASFTRPQVPGLYCASSMMSLSWLLGPNATALPKLLRFGCASPASLPRLRRYDCTSNDFASTALPPRLCLCCSGSLFQLNRSSSATLASLSYCCYLGC